MSKQVSVVCGFVATTVALAALMGTASAASSVIGSGSQQTCYWAAKTGAASNAALDSCNAALEDFSLSAEDRAATYANRSAVLLARDAPAEALKSVEQALAIAPELDDAAVNKAGALILLRRYAEARSTLDEALPLIQGDALVRGLFNRAVAAEALGDVKAAYYDYKRAVELSPEFEAARLELSRFQVARAEPGWQTAER